jgi:hypothetical protein
MIPCSAKNRLRGERSSIMKNLIKIIGIVALVLIVVFSVAGCRRRTADTETAPLTTVESVDEGTKSIDALISEIEANIGDLITRMEAGDYAALFELMALWAEWEEATDGVELTASQAARMEALEAMLNE